MPGRNGSHRPPAGRSLCWTYNRIHGCTLPQGDADGGSPTYMEALDRRKCACSGPLAPADIHRAYRWLIAVACVARQPTTVRKGAGHSRQRSGRFASQHTIGSTGLQQCLLRTLLVPRFGGPGRLNPAEIWTYEVLLQHVFPQWTAVNAPALRSRMAGSHRTARSPVVQALCRRRGREFRTATIGRPSSETSKR